MSLNETLLINKLITEIDEAKVLLDRYDSTSPGYEPLLYGTTSIINIITLRYHIRDLQRQARAAIKTEQRSRQSRSQSHGKNRAR